MINLVPAEGKKAVAREYWTRVLGVWALLLAVVLGVWALLLVPTYVLVERQLAARSLEVVAHEVEQEVAAHADAVAAVRHANELAKQLALYTDAPSASSVLTIVESAQSNAIAINGFLFLRNAGSVPQVEVRGVADTREALVTFLETLRRNPYVVDATVPVGDLANDRALPFTLTVVLAEGAGDT